MSIRTYMWLFAVILLVFSNIKPLTQQWVERSIFHERARHYQSIHEFSQSVVQFLHLEDLTEKFFRILVKTLHPTSVSLFLSDGKGNHRLHRTAGLDDPPAEHDVCVVGTVVFEQLFVMRDDQDAHLPAADFRN